jgi:hypothetical protein
VGFGVAKNSKDAKTKAATDLCNHLFMEGKMNKHDLSLVSGYNPSLCSTSFTVPSFIDTGSYFDSKVYKIRNRKEMINVYDFLNLWCLKNLNVHPYYEYSQLNQKVRFKLDKKFIYTVNLTFQSKVKFTTFKITS